MSWLKEWETKKHLLELEGMLDQDDLLDVSAEKILCAKVQCEKELSKETLPAKTASKSAMEKLRKLRKQKVELNSENFVFESPRASPVWREDERAAGLKCQEALRSEKDLKQRTEQQQKLEKQLGLDEQQRLDEQEQLRLESHRLENMQMLDQQQKLEKDQRQKKQLRMEEQLEEEVQRTDLATPARVRERRGGRRSPSSKRKWLDRLFQHHEWMVRKKGGTASC